MKFQSHQPDYFLIGLVLFLVTAGLIILSSASAVISQNLFKENYYFLKHQFFYSVGIGLIAFFILQRIDYRRWQKPALLLLILSIILLSLVFTPELGYDPTGAKRWIHLGLFSVQPFEFVKLTLILYLAAILGRKQQDETQTVKKSLLPCFSFLIIISVLLVLQPNFSAIMILLIISLLIYFLAGLKIYYIFGLGLISLPLFFIFIKLAPYRMNRLMVFLHPDTAPLSIGYQINQARLAIGSGGLLGLGLGHSIQKWQYLPEVIGDSIFAIFAEEFGFVGAAVLVLLFLLLAWRGLMIARRAPDRFGFLLAGGVTGWLVFQAFINIAAISGLIPLTGMPLPFISYGGSAMVSALAGAGILVNISRHGRQS